MYTNDIFHSLNIELKVRN